MRASFRDLLLTGLFASASGFPALRGVRTASSRVAISYRARVLSSSPGPDEPNGANEDNSAAPDREGELTLAEEFDLAMRSKLDLKDIVWREEQVIGAMIEDGKRDLQEIQAQFERDLQQVMVDTEARSKAASEILLRDINAQYDALEKAAREQRDIIMGVTKRPPDEDESATDSAAPSSVQSVVLIGAGGPLMRLVARQLAGSEGSAVRVRAVLVGDGAKGGRTDGLPAWPAGLTRAADGSTPSIPPVRPDGSPLPRSQARFELVDKVPSTGRAGLQSLVSGASSVLLCLVDGVNREFCLEESVARRWLESAGGSAPPNPNFPKLPIPLEPDDASGRLVLVASAQGTNRIGMLPYSLMNLWGQLDQWRKVEQDAAFGSKAKGFDFTIAHLGKLTSASPKPGATLTLEIAPGDAFGADLPLQLAADALSRVLAGSVPAARNGSFSVSGALGDVPPVATSTAAAASSAAAGETAAVTPAARAAAMADLQWADQLLKLDGPELARIPLRRDADTLAVLLWLRDFAMSFAKSPNTLSSAVQAFPLTDGAKIVFLKSGFEYSRGFDDKRDRPPAAASASASASSKSSASAEPRTDAAADEAGRAEALRGRPDGALRLILEESPPSGGGARVRVVRCDMRDAVVKEMSESAILRRLLNELPGKA